MELEGFPLRCCPRFDGSLQDWMGGLVQYSNGEGNKTIH
jgi:hypothetical protein